MRPIPIHPAYQNNRLSGPKPMDISSILRRGTHRRKGGEAVNSQPAQVEDGQAQQHSKASNRRIRLSSLPCWMLAPIAGKLQEPVGLHQIVCLPVLDIESTRSKASPRCLPVNSLSSYMIDEAHHSDERNTSLTL